MKNMFRKALVCILSVMFIFMSSVSLAEEKPGSIFSVDLSELTDEELLNAMSEIRAEQQKRIKTSIELDAPEITLNKGKKVQLKAKVIYLQEGVKAGKLQWASADESVAACKNGTITGMAPGETTVICTSVLSDGLEVKAECRVTVIIPVKTIKSNSKEIAVMATEYVKPDIDLQPEDATIQTLHYESSDEEILQVEEDGRIKALHPGEATVRAVTTDGTNKECTFSVKVKRLVGVTDSEITFQGLEWGVSQEEAHTFMRQKKLKTDDPGGFQMGKRDFFWPEDDFDLRKKNLPDIFKESSDLSDYYGPYEFGFKPLMDIGPYITSYVNLTFIPDHTNGKLDNTKENNHLIAVTVQYQKLSDPHLSDKFFSLLSMLEEKYGRFRLYIYNKPWGDYVAFQELGKYLKNYAGEMTMYTDYNTYNAFAVCKGINNTGILLRIDQSSNSVLLTYAKTDSWQDINDIAELLETKTNDRPSADL